jgi:hypothetical protein
MSEYSVEEAKGMVSMLAVAGDLSHERRTKLLGDACKMLTAYANLREQIERAREGVTDEVVELACAEYFGGDSWPEYVEEAELCRISMRKTLQSVAHLLPSGERGGVDESAEVRLGEYLKSQAGYACLNDQSRRNIANTFLAVAYPTHPPAQAAQVDSEGNALVPVAPRDASNYCRILSLLGMEEDGDPVAWVERMLSTTKPVAQGEAVASLRDREDVRALIGELVERIEALQGGVSGNQFEYRHLSLANSNGEQVWLPWQKFDQKMQIRCLNKQPRAVPDDRKLVGYVWPNEADYDHIHRCLGGDGDPEIRRIPAGAVGVYAMLAAAPSQGESA